MTRANGVRVQLDRLLLGTNPLVGVNHLDRSIARERESHQSFERILRVIELSFFAGAQGLTFTGDLEAYEILGALKKENIGYELGLYPLLPDTQSYKNSISERGITSAAIDVLRTLSPIDKAKTLVRGGLSIIGADLVRIMKLYVDIETNKLIEAMPARAKLKAVLAHEIFTDVAISFKAKELMKTYASHLKGDIGITPGFVTRNFAKFVEVWQEWEFLTDDIAIMTPINKLGFQMTPSREASERTLSKLQGLTSSP